MNRMEVKQSDTDLGPFSRDDFETIYAEYFPKIYNYIRFRIIDPHDTDDLTSKVFERVMINAGRYRSERGSLAAWIFTIANHTVIDYWKTRNGKISKVSLDKLTHMISGEKSLEREVADRELKNHLLLALQEIADEKRAIIALKFWSGLSNREIAAMTGMTESNVGVTIYRTLKQLRAILVQRGVDLHE